MIDVTVTPFYAAIIAILMAALSIWVGVTRGRTSVALGDGGNSALALATRRFGNLSEYAAIVLFLMLMMELKGASETYLHAYGLILVLLRLLHPVVLFDDVDAPTWKKIGRFIAAAGTAAMMIVAAITILMMG